MKFVTIFGSARIKPDSKFYKITFELSKRLSKAGYGIVTGGGLGIMEAANKGAFSQGGASIGINIALPFEQIPNSYCTELETIDNLSIRRDKLIKKSKNFIIMPGGFGTLDEFFEVVTLKQVRLREHKIVLCCKAFWQPLLDFFKLSLEEYEMISKDEKLFLLSDDFDEIISYLQD